MRIALIIDWLKSDVMSGSHFEQAILREIDSIKNSGHTFFVITHSDLNVEKPVYNNNIKYVSTKDYQNRFNKFPNSFESRFTLKLVTNRLSRIFLKPGFIERLKNHITQSGLSRALSENRIDIAWNIYATEMIDVPYIATCLDCYDLTDPFLPENNRPDYWVKWNNKSFHYYRRATFILASTLVLKKQLEKFYGLDGSKIIVNPFFTPVFDGLHTTFDSKDITGMQFDKDFLFYPAKYSPQKNHIVIIEALKVLKNSKKFFPHVIFCGKNIGNLEYLQFKVKEYGLEDQFTFLGVVDFPSLVYLYKHAKALVYASFVGPDNLPPLEAFSYNCPVIASNVSGAVEQLGTAALLFERTDELKLAEHIFSIHENPKLVEELIIKGKIVSDSTTVQIYVNNVLKIFNEFPKYQRAWGDRNYKPSPETP